jgi:hypothetical protein
MLLIVSSIVADPGSGRLAHDATLVRKKRCSSPKHHSAAHHIIHRRQAKPCCRRQVKNRSHVARCRRRKRRIGLTDTTLILSCFFFAPTVLFRRHIYQKWNQRLFYEMYSAYRAGRADNDPSVAWYEGELWFYDNYVVSEPKLSLRLSLPSACANQKRPSQFNSLNHGSFQIPLAKKLKECGVFGVARWVG